MTLPKYLEQDYQQELKRIEEENRMPYILSFERRALEAEAAQQAAEQAAQAAQQAAEQAAEQAAQAAQQARQQVHQEAVIQALRFRFETVPNSLEEAINQIKDESVLKALHGQAIAVGSIEEFEQHIDTLIPKDAREEERPETYVPNLETREILARLDGILQKGREDILEVLRVRFEDDLNSLEAAINQIEDDLVLKTLLRQAITINSVEEFHQELTRLTAANE